MTSANSEVLISGQTGERVTIRRGNAIGLEGWFDAEVDVRVTLLCRVAFPAVLAHASPDRSVPDQSSPQA